MPSVELIYAEYLPSGEKDRNLQLPAKGGIYNPFNLGLYTYVDSNPLTGIDPTGLWSLKVSWYWGRGGSLSLGHDQGQWFVRGGAGVGVGGGIKFYPIGDFPGESNGNERAFIGASANIGATLGPMSAEYKWQAGDVITKDPETGKPRMDYVEEGKPDVSLRGKAGWGTSVGGGINIVDLGIAW